MAWTDTAFGGVLKDEFGSIKRTNDANALLAKLDFRLSPKHNATLKYNYTRSSQENGTFDVDSWGRSSNATENDHSHAVNGSLTSVFTSALSNEFRFQWAREDRPRPYSGAINPNTGRPFPDTDIDSLGGYRIGMPFFIPLQTAYDFRLQLVDNVSIVKGNHLFKFGGEFNRTGVNQTFLGFANGRISFNTVQGFLNYVANSVPATWSARTGRATPTGSCAGGASDRGAGEPLSPAGGRAAAHRRRGRNPDDHSVRICGVPAGQLEAELQTHAELRPALGGPDRAQFDYAHRRSVLWSVHRADGDQRDRDIHLSRGRHDPIRQIDVSTEVRVRVRREG